MLKLIKVTHQFFTIDEDINGQKRNIYYRNSNRAKLNFSSRVI